MMLWLLLALLALELCPSSGYNYCNNANLCKDDEHFMCSLEDELPPYEGTAKYIAHLPDTPKLRKAFIDFHNENRNRLAGGECQNHNGTNYPNASRLREVIWDAELAYMARVHTRLVCFKHSKCQRTARLAIVGQNLGFSGFADVVGLQDLINKNMARMFNESFLVDDPSELAAKFDGSKHMRAGHFTVMASDRVSRIGCAVSMADNCLASDSSRLCHFTTCHYDFSNLVGSYLYKVGETASKCDDWNVGKSKKYDNLCGNTGEIFLRDHPSNQ